MADDPEPYDATHYSPPAPVARVGPRGADGAVVVHDVVLLLDTGADVTLLPRSAVVRLGIPIRDDETYELVGFDGAKSFAASVDLDMVFQRRASRGRYLLTDDPHGILGRDVLNHLSVRLDGPRQEWLS